MLCGPFINGSSYANSVRARLGALGARASNRAFSAVLHGMRFVEIVIGVIAFINNSFCPRFLVNVALFG